MKFAILPERFERILLSRFQGYRGACLLSLLAHCILFSIASVILFFLKTPNLDSSPLIFDIVFAPSGAYSTSGENRIKLHDESKMQDQATPGRSHLPSSLRNEPIIARAESDIEKAPPTDDPVITEEVIIETPDTEPQPPEIAPDDATSHDELQPSYVPEAGESEETPDQLLPSTVEAVPIAATMFKEARPNPVTARVHLTHKQREMLFKRFRKWTENFSRMDLTDSSMVWEHKGKTYAATFRHVPGKSETDIDEVAVEISTTENGYALSSKMRMKRLAFSNFAQFVDYWDPRVAVHDDVLDGRFHSNTKINITSSLGVKPEFRGKVTTASYEIRTSGPRFFREESVFLGGLETGVKEIRLPKRFLPFLADSLVSGTHSQIIAEEGYITFHRDGTYSYYPKEQPELSERRKLPDEPYYIFGVDKAKLHVRGVVDGVVLLYSSGDIVIQDDLVYAVHPQLDETSDDYLGLVSDKDIEIAHPSVTGPGDLTIHAAIYAKGRFCVPHLGGKRGSTLAVYGSMTAGSISATEPRYATHVQFDKRLEKNRPPSFPMTDRYEVTDWDGTWTVGSGKRNLK